MAGLVPAIHVFFTALTDRPHMAGWVYIMTNKRNGTLYVGVGSRFVRRYGLTRLVYFEHHEGHTHGNPTRNQPQALAPHLEVRLLAAGNPDWEDLYASLLS
jgi:putative endonuclease